MKSFYFILSFSISTRIRQPYLVQVPERLKPRPNAGETENVVSDSKVLAARTRNLTDFNSGFGLDEIERGNLNN